MISNGVINLGVVHRRAAHRDTYRQAIEKAGLRVEQTKVNPYRYISDQARGASGTFGVHSFSLLAVKPQGSRR